MFILIIAQFLIMDLELEAYVLRLISFEVPAQSKDYPKKIRIFPYLKILRIIIFM